MADSWFPPPDIGEFRIERILGRGATARVWLARDTILERDVALKIARDVPSLESRKRFRMEARAVARLSHPNLVAIHHVGEVDERPFLVTDYLEGCSLDALKLPLPPERVVAIGLDLARGLAAAHRAGVVHRDIKPANAFLGDDGVSRLLDFGLAKLSEPDDIRADAVRAGAQLASRNEAPGATRGAATVAGQIVGTPLYMPPEVWRGDPSTRLSDIYALGAVLFELLTAIPPSLAGVAEGAEVTIEELQNHALRGELGDLAELAPAAPAALVGLISRCLSLEPNDRPYADEVCDALVRLQTRVGSSAAEALDDARLNPYRGLLAFEADHRAVFFGREAEAAAVIVELRASPFVLVAGASGVGKSSLVRAGVVPLIEKGALGRVGPAWRTVTLVPGHHPLEALARELLAVLRATGHDVAAEQAQSPEWVADTLRLSRARLVIVLDQLEELWTLAAVAERRTFFRVIAAVVQAAPTVRFVATLRSDFLGRLEDMGELQAQALRSLLALRRMTEDGLRRAIVEPAARRGVVLDEALVERLLEGREGGSLPLLEFALEQLYARRAPGQDALGLADLDALGGVEGALATHADDTLAQRTQLEQRAARRLLLALVTTDGTRARKDLRDLIAVGEDGNTRSALDALVEGRLVVAGAGDDGASFEVAHEALLTGWPTLRRWLDDEATSRKAAARLATAAEEWARLGRGREGLASARVLSELDVPGALEDAADEVTAFVAASRRALVLARRWRRSVIVGAPSVVLLLAAAAWAELHARHLSAVAASLAHARQLHATSEVVAEAAARARMEAFALFERDDLQPAEARWKQALALEEDADRERRDIDVALGAVLALEPRADDARALRADVTLARLRAAGRLHKPGLVASLRALLTVDDDGSRAALLDARSHVRVETDPPGAALTLARYREDASGKLVEAESDELVAGRLAELEPGSYLIVASAPLRHSTRYPFLLRAGEEQSLRVVLPRAENVPEGMIYVPAGRTLYGSDDDEETRVFYTHQPAHDVEVGAFLIARTEVTNGDYVTFLEALPERAREESLPESFTMTKGGHIGWELPGQPLQPNQLYCNGVLPCVPWLRLPVSMTSREDGERYTAWLARSRRLPGARLCADREWERAARGADNRRNPSGNGDLGPNDACTLATYSGDASHAGPCAAGTHGASRSPFGVEDMVGNVWEWTAGPADIGQPGQGVGRGAGWTSSGSLLAISNRGIFGTKIRYFGLRVCSDLQ